MQIGECVPLFREEPFAARGLKLDTRQSPGGALILNSLLGNGLDVGFSNMVSPILAASQGADVVAIAGLTYEDSKYTGHALVAKPGAGISEASGLIGKTIAVNTLRNIDHLMLLSWLRDGGVKPQDIRLVEVPFPKMTTVLQGGEVDAIAIVEPFLSMALRQGLSEVANYYVVKEAPAVEVTSYFARKAWLNENAEAAIAFREALGENIKYYAENPGEFRRALRTLTGLDEETVENLRLPAFGYLPTASGIKYLITRLRAEAFLEREVIAESMVWNEPPGN